jgi:hypothetical protein
MNKNIAFLVLSCDKYSDLWEPFAQLFERYWPDCPFDKYFASNQTPFDKYGFQPILMGEDKTWSSGLQTALLQLKNKYDYVLITLEDLFILERVDNEFVNESIKSFVYIRGNYLKLYVQRKPHNQLNKYFGELAKNVPYRHNCVYSVWKIDTLLNILVPNENAWEFEKVGAERIANTDGFYSSMTNCFIIANTLIKGKWAKTELKKIKKDISNIQIQRDLLSNIEERKYYIRKYFLNFFLKYTPINVQAKIINYIRQILSKK